MFISELSFPCNSVNFSGLFKKALVSIWHFLNTTTKLTSVNKLKMVCCVWLCFSLFLNRNFKTSQVILGEFRHCDVLRGSCTPYKNLTAVVREVLSF